MVEILHHLLHNIYDCNLDHLENLIMEGVTNAFTDTLRECFFFFFFFFFFFCCCCFFHFLIIVFYFIFRMGTSYPSAILY